MTRLYDRDCSLIVDGGSGGRLDLSEFRITFQTEDQTTQTLGKCVVKIYNLSESTAKSLPKTGGKIQLIAGYKGLSGVIFSGNVRERQIGRENPTDTVTTLYAADGDRAYVYAVTSKTIPAGGTSKSIYDACLDAMSQFGIKQGYVPPVLGQQKDPRAMALFGMSRDVMRKMALAHGCTWNIRAGRLNVVPVGEAIPGDAIELNSNTGMIGRATQTDQGIIVRSLINPRIEVDKRVRINEKSIDLAPFNLDIKGEPMNEAPYKGVISADGIYKVQAIRASGDTRGNDWYFDLICNALGEVTKSSAGIGLV